MASTSRPPDRVVSLPGPRGNSWTAHVVYGDVPYAVGWRRVEDALVRLMLPKVRELMAHERRGEDGHGDTA